MKFWCMVAMTTLMGCQPDTPPAAADPLARHLQHIHHMIDDPLLDDLTVQDISVPFEGYLQAPAALQRVALLHTERKVGIYVMRYHDDSLRQIDHVFAISERGSIYFKFVTQPPETDPPLRFNFSATRFDPATSTLRLVQGDAVIDITPQDVTPAGA